MSPTQAYPTISLPHRGPPDHWSSFTAGIHRFLPLIAAIGLTISQPAAAQTTITFTDGETNAATYNTTGNNHTLTITSGSATQSGIISGSGTVTKTGGGTLALTAINTYSGTTTVSDGTLGITNASNLGTGNIAINTGGTLTVSSDLSDSLGRTITVDGAGATFTGEGYLWFNRASSTSTTIDVTNGGTLSAATSISLADSSSSTHTLTVSGTDSSVTAGTTLFVGYLGAASVNIASGGTVTTGTLDLASQSIGSATLNLNSGGTLAVSGGTNAIIAGAGSTAFNLGGGTLRVTDSNLTTSVGMTLVNATDSSIDTNGLNAELSGIISGDGALTKIGEGILTLLASNLYTGGTTVEAGTLATTNLANLGSGNITVSSGGHLTASGDLDFATSRDLTVTGTGSSLAAGHIWFGTASGANNTVTVADGGSITTTTTFSLGDNGGTSGLSVTGANSIVDATGNFYVGYASGGTATVASGGTLATDAQFSLGTSGGTGILNLNDGGTLQVGGTNGIAIGTGSGTFNFNGGTLQVAGSNLTSTVPMTLGDATTSTVNTNSFDATLSGALSGDGAIAKSGSGTLTLAAANTHTGGTLVNAGTLTLGHASALGATTGSLTLNGGTLDLGGFSPTTGKVVFNGGAFTNGSIANTSLYEVQSGLIDFALTGSAALTKTGPGTAILTSTNAYSGTTTVDGGTLQLGNNTETGSLTSSSIVLNEGGTLAYHRSNDPTYAAVFSGAGNLLKLGPNTLTLTGYNTFTGTATVSGGTLSLTTDAMRTAATYSVESGANLDIHANGTSISFPTVSGMTLSGAGNVRVWGNGSGWFGLSKVDQTNLTGTLTVDNGSRLVSSNGLNLDNAQLNVAAGGQFALGHTAVSVGSLTGSGDILQGWDSSVRTLTIGADDQNTTFSGVIHGNNTSSTLGNLETGVLALTKIGTGNLTLSGANTYSGGTTVSTGALTGNTTSLQGNITNNASLVFDQASTSSYAGIIDGTGSLTKSGNGTLSFTNNNTFTGATTISAGTLQLGDGGTAGSITSSSIVNNSSLVFNRSNELELTGVISGTGDVTQNGSGTTTLTSTNTYTGGTTVSTGTLVLQGSAINSAGAFAVSSGANLNLEPTEGTFSAPLQTYLAPSGAGTVNITGDGTKWVALRGTDQTSLTGTLSVQPSGRLMSWSGLDLSNAELNVASGAQFGTADTSVTVGSLTGAGDIFQGWDGTLRTLTVGAGDGDSTFSGVIHGNSSSFTRGDLETGFLTLTKTGTGTLTLSGANTYAGNTTVSGGTLRLGAANVLSDATGVAVAASTTFDLDGYSDTIGSLAGAGDVSLGAATLTTGANHTDTSFSGVISGTGGIVKTGSGTLSLTNTNTYQGGTSVTGGLIEFDSLANFGSANITLNGGGLRWASGTTIDVSSRLNALDANGAIFDTNNNDVTFASALSGADRSVTKIGTGTLTLDGASSTLGIVAINGGNLNLTNGANLTSNTWVSFADGSGSSGSGSITDATLDVGTILYVGYAGASTLDIGSGGIVNADQLQLAGTAAGSATVNLNAGGTLKVGGADGIKTGSGTTSLNFAKLASQ